MVQALLAAAAPGGLGTAARGLIVHTAKANQFTLAHTDSLIRRRTDLGQAYFKLPGGRL